MSKIGKKPISILPGIKIDLANQILKVAGPLGEIVVNLPVGIKIEMQEDKILLTTDPGLENISALHGTHARLVQNALAGVTKGFEKVLEIVGTGYRGQMEGEVLVLSLGYSHPVRFPNPEGIKLSVQENKIKIFGINKEKVGDTAYKIRKLRPPDSYKGKGIRYLGEKLKLKPGKAAAKTTGAGGK